jgi:hypothetical protein
VLEKGGKERLLSQLSFAVSFRTNEAFSANYRLIILSETFVFPLVVKKQRSEHTELQLCLLVYVGMKLGFSYDGKNMR